MRVKFETLVPDADTEALFRSYSTEELRALLAAHGHDIAKASAAGMIFGVSRITLIVLILLEREPRVT